MTSCGVVDVIHPCQLDLVYFVQFHTPSSLQPIITSHTLRPLFLSAQSNELPRQRHHKAAAIDTDYSSQHHHHHNLSHTRNGNTPLPHPSLLPPHLSTLHPLTRPLPQYSLTLPPPTHLPLLLSHLHLSPRPRIPFTHQQHNAPMAIHDVQHITLPQHDARNPMHRPGTCAIAVWRRGKSWGCRRGGWGWRCRDSACGGCAQVGRGY